MARVELELPDRWDFTTELPVRIQDLNYGGHVGHDKLLGYTHEARAQLFASQGWSELDVAGGIGIAIVDTAAVYAREVKYGMSLLVEVAVTALRSRGCELYYRITDRASGTEMVRAKTGIVFFDYRTGKVGHMPEVFRAAFQR
ncbi:MAG: thioesterase family protein [Anaeromyxobacter sp.]